MVVVSSDMVLFLGVIFGGHQPHSAWTAPACGSLRCWGHWEVGSRVGVLVFPSDNPVVSRCGYGCTQVWICPSKPLGMHTAFQYGYYVLLPSMRVMSPWPFCLGQASCPCTTGNLRGEVLRCAFPARMCGAVWGGLANIQLSDVGQVVPVGSPAGLEHI